MKRKLEVVTTYNKKYYDICGKKMIETFIAHWPKDETLYCYYQEQEPEILEDNIVYHELYQVQPQLKQFVDKWKDDPENLIELIYKNKNFGNELNDDYQAVAIEVIKEPTIGEEYIGKHIVLVGDQRDELYNYLDGFVFDENGKFIEEIFILVPISVPFKSIIMSSGILSAGHLNSTFLLTIFSTPPLFKPGEFS